MEEEILRDFPKLLIQITFSPTEKVVSVLLNIIKEKPSTVLALTSRWEGGPIMSFISVLLNKNASWGAREKAVKCIRSFCAIKKIETLHTFKLCYMAVSSQIFDVASCSLSKEQIGETRLTVMECLKSLIDNITDEALSTVFELPNMAFLSQGVLLACKILAFDRDTQARVAALEFILALSLYGRDCAFIGKVEDIFMHFVPGLSIALAQAILQRVAVTHHKVIQLALRAWGHILRLTLCDLPSETPELTDLDRMRSWLEGSPNGEDGEISAEVLEKPRRTMKWKKAAGRALWNIMSATSKSWWYHPHPTVRKELVNFNMVILEACPESLGERSVYALDSLVHLFVDKNKDVSSYAISSVKKLPAERIRVMAQNRLPWVVTRLCRLLRVGDKEDAGDLLELLAGYMMGLSSVLPTTHRFLSSPVHVRNLADALSIAASLELSSNILQMDVSGTDNAPSSVLKFSHINEDDGKALSAIAGYAKEALPGLIDCLTQETTIGNLHALNILLEEASGMSVPMTETILRYYLSVNWKRRIDDGKTPKERQTIALEIILSTIGIGTLSLRCPESHLEQFVLLALYSIVARMGSAFAHVRSTAEVTAELLSKVCQCSSVAELLQQNAEMLVHFITINLRQRSPDVLDAAKVAVAKCPAHALSYLQAVVDMVLKCSNVRSHQLVPYLGIFLVIVRCTAAARPSKVGRQPCQGIHSNCQRSKKSERSWLASLRLLDHIDQLLAAQEENEQEEDMEVEKINDNAEAVDDSAVQLCISVVKRSLHCLASRNTDVVLAAIEVVREGILVVADWDKQLLEIVHKVWGPLVKKLNPRSDFLLLHHCFLLLTTLAAVAKDFIRFRTLKEVLPGLKDAMIQLSSSSRDVARNSAYNTTQKFKLQRAVLEGLGPLTCDLNLRERETDSVVEVAMPYLSVRQHRVLQEKAVELFKTLLRHDPYLVEYRLKTLASTKEFTENVRRVFSLAEE